MIKGIKKTLGIGSAPKLEITESSLIAEGKLFPPKAHRERLDRYRRNKELFLGNNFDVFKDFKGSKQQQDLLYISVNLAGVVCKKSADFLFGETVQISAGNGEQSKEQQALNRLVEDNNFNILTYESALSNAYRGDSFIKVRYGQEFGGEVSKELDPYKVVIEPISSDTVFPEVSLYDKNKIVAYHIAVPVKVIIDGSKSWQLFVESHYAGRIEERVFNITSKETVYVKGFEEALTWEIGSEIMSARKIIPTGVAMPLVVHIPNYAIDESWEGIDDITEHISVLEEINTRLTEIALIISRHSDPCMAVPAGVLGEDIDGNPIFNVQRDKVFEVMGKDDILPSYITWDGQLAHAFKELEVLIDFFLMTAEIPGVVLGKGDSGTSGTSGLAIKWRMNSLLAKINRKRQYFDKGIKRLLFIAQQLETSVGNETYTPVIPKLSFQDGLPQDDTEQATIMSIRTGGAKTLSQKTAIMRLEGMTEEQADLEIERIANEQEEEMKQQATVDVDSLFNKPSHEDLDSNNTEKHAEGNPVSDKAIIKE